MIRIVVCRRHAIEHLQLIYVFMFVIFLVTFNINNFGVAQFCCATEAVWIIIIVDNFIVRSILYFAFHQVHFLLLLCVLAVLLTILGSILFQVNIIILGIFDRS